MIEAIIQERARTHGDWNEVARVSHAIKAAYRSASGWESMTPSQKESLDMDAMKQARIVCGNANERDHWLDRVGYATLVLEGLE